jgi:hypothetical protein
MNTTQATKLAETLKKGNLYAAVEGDRIEFLGGAFGSHGLWLSVSSEERVLAHWDGYCSAQPKAEPVAPKLTTYTVVVEGSMSYNDGWEKSRITITGWIEVQAASPREVRGLARQNQSLVQWEYDDSETTGKVQFLRTRSFEVKS